MCWSGQASACLALFGYTGAFFEFRKMRKYQQRWNDTNGLRGITIFYLSLMETLQAVNYLVLNTPGFFNSLCALLGYLHVCFQPFFISFMYLSWLPKKRRMYWMKYAMFFSAISAIALLSRLSTSHSLPGCFSQHCTPVVSMESLLNLKTQFGHTIGCAKTSFLSYRGDWHIAWQWVLNNCSYFVFTYYFTVFVFPCFYGVYLAVLASSLYGPVASIFLSTNPDEFGAIWCLIAIGLVSSVKIPILDKFFTVTHESWKDTWEAMFLRLNKLHKSFYVDFNHGK
ncbi:DUF5765 domain-containing protein [Legionella parisiensis]|uniref:Uncharacterized protein n=1 Tax=Legionella parisiensis TaxID=45071 RepID=A0A1E5JTY3_9GAMM|nr:DUF5765 domain-containing protein [Legionella parisiensis]KTD43090.1 hypothetical protein Lpar_1067 [Legionella parisiensis]OEH47969.1 hypothetical protein lpari_00993 [Legionella parisiensis]STX77831.1 Uncharacterised protein [Legionella parisiensis]